MHTTVTAPIGPRVTKPKLLKTSVKVLGWAFLVGAVEPFAPGVALKANRKSCNSLSGLERQAVELLEPVEYEGYIGMAGRFVA